MTELLPLVGTAAALGFTAGVTPGPLSALALAETLAGGWRRGAWVAVAPAFTDVPLVLLVWLISAWLSAGMLALAAVLGAVYLAYLGFQTWRAAAQVEPLARGSGGGGQTLLRAIVANLLNPNPYVFWAFVGVPLLGAAARISWASAPIVFGCFMGVLIATKLVLILLVDRGRSVLGSRGYRWTLRGSALLLVVMAGLTLAEGLSALSGPTIS